MNDETKKHLQKLESDLSALRIILDSPPHDGRHAEAQSAFRVARLTFKNMKDALDDAPEPVPASIEDVAEALGVGPAKLENIIGSSVREALDRVLERIVREVLGQ
jgi:hypothetical protein